MPASTGHRRASRKTPALTIVAECRYADTGVGAAIACGSQKWNGNCALLVSAPSSTRPSDERIERMGAHRVAAGEDALEVVAADDRAEQEDAGEQREPAGRGDGERHPRAAPRVATVVPVADQQEREQARQLPEHDELDEVARDDDAEHRAHEAEQQRIEARGRIAGREVVARIGDDEHADAAHQHREQPGEAVDAHHQVDAEARQPGDAFDDDAAVAHLGKEQRRPARRSQGRPGPRRWERDCARASAGTPRARCRRTAAGAEGPTTPDESSARPGRSRRFGPRSR